MSPEDIERELRQHPGMDVDIVEERAAVEFGGGDVRAERFRGEPTEGCTQGVCPREASCGAGGAAPLRGGVDNSLCDQLRGDAPLSPAWDGAPVDAKPVAVLDGCANEGPRQFEMSSHGDWLAEVAAGSHAGNGDVRVSGSFPCR